MDDSLAKLAARAEVYRFLSQAYHTPEVSFFKGDFPSSLARANIYSFLSRALQEPPSESFLLPFRQPELMGSLRILFGEDVLSYFSEIAEHSPGDMAALVQEYNDLFVVPLERYVTPYEAVYRDQREVEGKLVKGLLMGESTLAVLQSYREAGVTLSDDFLDMPDHAGLEFSFMSYLCSKQAEAMNQGDNQEVLKLLQLQKNFLQEHLASWIPDLCARIHDNAQESFYKGIANLIEAFLTLEAETLSQF